MRKQSKRIRLHGSSFLSYYNGFIECFTSGKKKLSKNYVAEFQSESSYTVTSINIKVSAKTHISFTRYWILKKIKPS